MIFFLNDWNPTNDPHMIFPPTNIRNHSINLFPAISVIPPFSPHIFTKISEFGTNSTEQWVEKPLWHCYLKWDCQFYYWILRHPKQFLTDAREKVADDNTNVGALATHVGDLNSNPSSWLGFLTGYPDFYPKLTNHNRSQSNLSKFYNWHLMYAINLWMICYGY